MTMSAERTKPDVFYTMTPSVVVIKLVEHPVSLLILHYILIRKKVYPKFRISDIAKQLKKDDRTIRDNLKPLVELDLLALAGKIGAQYHEFNEDKYESYLRVNVFELAKNPFQELGGVPSQRTGGGGIPKNESSPLPKNGRVENKGEKKEKDEIKERAGESLASGSDLGLGEPLNAAGDCPAPIQDACSGVLVSASMIQHPPQADAKATALKNSTGHPGTSANGATGTMATSGGLRGAMPSPAERFARCLAKDWKTSRVLRRLHSYHGRRILENTL